MTREIKDPPKASDAQSLSDQVKRLMEQRKWAQAIEAALSQPDGAMQDHDTCWNVGWAYLKLKQLAEAKKFLTQASRILRKPSTMWALGVIHREMGQFETAKENQRESLAMREGHLARMELAIVLMEQGRCGEAEQVYQEGLRLRPKSQEIRLHYTGFLVDEGRMDEARRTYEEAEILLVQGRYKRDRNTLLALAGTEVKTVLSDASCVSSAEVRWSGYPISISHEGRLEVFPDGVGADERILPAGYSHQPNRTCPEVLDTIGSFFRSATDEPAYFIDLGSSFDEQSPAFKIPFKWGISNVEALFRIRDQGIALVGSSFENGLVVRAVPGGARTEAGQWNIGYWTSGSPKWKSSLHRALAAHSGQDA